MPLGRTLFKKPIHRVEKKASGWLLEAFTFHFENMCYFVHYC